MLVTRRSLVLRCGVHAAPSGVRATGPDSLGKRRRRARAGTPCARSPGIWSFRIARSYSIPIRMPRPDSTSDSPDAPRTIDRREALRRAALMLGGVISAPVIAGVLAGCEGRPGRGGGGGGGGGGRRSGALSSEQLELVATIAEHIVPETDTPGARAVGVHEFIDAMLAEGYAGEDRARFFAGLADVDARARVAGGGRPFLECAREQQRAVLEDLDHETFAQPAPRPGSAEVPFFRTFKELTLVGYYTSEIGATRELHHEPVPGRYDGCVPLAKIGRTWAV